MERLMNATIVQSDVELNGSIKIGTEEITLI